MIRMMFLILLTWLSTNLSAQKLTYIQTLEKKYTTGLFSSDNAHILVPMNDPAASSAINIFQYLQAKVPGLSIYGAQTYSPAVSYRLGTPAFFLDEMRVDIRALLSVNVNDVALVKVFRPPFLGSIGGANGAIAVYTKEGDEGEY